MEDEASYFRRRTAEKLAAAERAGDDVAARIHRSLAAGMLARAAGSPAQLAGAARPPATRSAVRLA